MEIEKKKPSILMSISVFVGMLLILSFGVILGGLDIISALMICFVIIFVLSLTYGYSIDELFTAMGKSLGDATMSLFFFFLIGMLMAMWIASGTIPTLIYYGLNSISPALFLPLGFFACAVVSFVTGTSWGTAGTIGVALFGMGVGMGMDPALVVGMIVSGSSFGDYCSPLSETTVLTSQSVQIDLYKHVESMWRTLLPSIIITLAVFTYLGSGSTTAGNVDETSAILDALAGNFHIGFMTLIPIIVVLGLSVFKVPTVPTLLIGIGLGFITAIINQDQNPVALLNMLNYGYSLESGNEMVDTLVNRGGIQSMMWTFSLAFISMLISGMLEKVGYLKVLIAVLIDRIVNKGLLILVTFVTSVLGCMAMAENYLSVIINGSLFKDVYPKKGLDKAVLSRTIEEGSTLAAFLIPWTTSGAFIVATLGVQTFDFFQYAIFLLVEPVVTIGLAFFGIGIKAKHKKTIEEPIEEIAAEAR